MSANYVSPKPDGYMKTRNSIYRDREIKVEARAVAEQDALRNVAPQSQANYGKKLDKKGY